MPRDGKNELNLNHTLMLLPRKMLTLHLLWHPSSLWGAQLSEPVGWPSLGKCARQLLLQTSLGCCGWQHGPDSREDPRQEPLSLQRELGCCMHRSASPTAKGALSRGSAQIHPSISALETCKITRGEEERYRCKHPEGQRSMRGEEM